MCSSIVLANSPLSWPEWQRLLAGVALTTVGWVAVTLLTPATDKRVLREFVRLVRPGGAGWRKVEDEARANGMNLCADHEPDDLPGALLNMLLACLGVYGALFATGYGLYGNRLACLGLTVFTVAIVALLAKRVVLSKHRE